MAERFPDYEYEDHSIFRVIPEVTSRMNRPKATLYHNERSYSWTIRECLVMWAVWAEDERKNHYFNAIHATHGMNYGPVNTFKMLQIGDMPKTVRVDKVSIPRRQEEARQSCEIALHSRKRIGPISGGFIRTDHPWLATLIDIYNHSVESYETEQIVSSMRGQLEGRIKHQLELRNVPDVEKYYAEYEDKLIKSYLADQYNVDEDVFDFAIQANQAASLYKKLKFTIRSYVYSSLIAAAKSVDKTKAFQEKLFTVLLDQMDIDHVDMPMGFIPSDSLIMYTQKINAPGEYHLVSSLSICFQAEKLGYSDIARFLKMTYEVRLRNAGRTLVSLLTEVIEKTGLAMADIIHMLRLQINEPEIRALAMHMEVGLIRNGGDVYYPYPNFSDHGFSLGAIIKLLSARSGMSLMVTLITILEKIVRGTTIRELKTNTELPEMQKENAQLLGYGFVRMLRKTKKMKGTPAALELLDEGRKHQEADSDYSSDDDNNQDEGSNRQAYASDDDVFVPSSRPFTYEKKKKKAAQRSSSPRRSNSGESAASNDKLSEYDFS